ncbi:MAG: hypothetical protein ABGY96_08785, partial [bacterium]
YVAFLAFHTIGLVFLVGVSGIVAMRILGVARSLPLGPLLDFFPLLYLGVCINVVTGVVLLCLYPTNYIVDPTMYIKAVAIIVAIIMVRKLKTYLLNLELGIVSESESRDMKTWARTLLVAWLFAVLTGRTVAYGLATKIQTSIAVLIVVSLVLLIGYFAGRSLGWINRFEQDA